MKCKQYRKAYFVKDFPHLAMILQLGNSQKNAGNDILFHCVLSCANGTNLTFLSSKYT